jgi:hypothetical protein
MPIPEFNGIGDLPPGVHSATMEEVTARFGANTRQRRAVTARMLRVYDLAKATGKLERFILFGSYVTGNPDPNDVDVFLVMSQAFNIDDCTDATRSLFSHARSQRMFGATVFWAQQGTSLLAIEDLIEGWQTKRDGTRRGIVEVVNDSE